MSRIMICFASIFLAATNTTAASAQGSLPTVEGKIRYQTRAPGREFLIELQTQDRRVIQTARIRGDNDFRFQGLISGEYYIHIDVEGFEEVQQSFEIRGGPTYVNVLLREKIGGTASGRGGFAGGNPNLVDIEALAAKHPEEAVEEYEKSLEDVRKGDTNRAIDRLEKSLRLAPDFFQARNNLGIQYQKLRRYEDAESEFRQAHALNRNEAQPLINLGNLWLVQDDFRPAATVLREAVRLDPTSAPALYYLGSALYKTAAFQEAEGALVRAIELDPRSSQARLMLVNVYMQEEKYQQALAQLNVYLEDSPDGDERKAVEELRARLLKMLNE